MERDPGGNSNATRVGMATQRAAGACGASEEEGEGGREEERGRGGGGGGLWWFDMSVVERRTFGRDRAVTQWVSWW
jgi:hypothetical protein